MPDARSNILPVERFFLYSCKVACAGSDLVAAVSHCREMLTIVSSFGMQRFFNLPFVLEARIKSYILLSSLSYSTYPYSGSDLLLT